MPLENCLKSVEILKKNFFVKKISRFYKTEPIPKSDQPWYVNAVVEIKTTLKPYDILKKLFLIRITLRESEKKNEARVIDLDLLCYNKIINTNLNLTIPHPRMHLRKFVVQPICDINPSWIHPVLKIKAKILLKKLANQKIFYINQLNGKSNHRRLHHTQFLIDFN